MQGMIVGGDKNILFFHIIHVCITNSEGEKPRCLDDSHSVENKCKQNYDIKMITPISWKIFILLFSLLTDVVSRTRLINYSTYLHDHLALFWWNRSLRIARGKTGLFAFFLFAVIVFFLYSWMNVVFFCMGIRWSRKMGSVLDMGIEVRCNFSVF